MPRTKAAKCLGSSPLSSSDSEVTLPAHGAQIRCRIFSASFALSAVKKRGAPTYQGQPAARVGESTSLWTRYTCAVASDSPLGAGMQTLIPSALGSLIVILSAVGTRALSVETVRVVLPQPASPVIQNIAGVLDRQVAQRCDARVVLHGEAPLVLELTIAPGIGTDGFRIEDRPGGGVKISSSDSRGLLYGAGKLLRTSRYDQDGFSLGTWRGTSIPDKPVRGIYFATHFHNFYHDALLEKHRPSGNCGPWSLKGARADGAGRQSAHTAVASELAVADPLFACPGGCAAVAQPGSYAGRRPERCLSGVDPHLSRSERRAVRQAAVGRSDRAARGNSAG